MDALKAYIDALRGRYSWKYTVDYYTIYYNTRFSDQSKRRVTCNWCGARQLRCRCLQPGLQGSGSWCGPPDIKGSWWFLEILPSLYLKKMICSIQISNGYYIPRVLSMPDISWLRYGSIWCHQHDFWKLAQNPLNNHDLIPLTRDIFFRMIFIK